MDPDTIPRSARRTLRALAAPGRFRVRRHAEGSPVIPGKFGQIEFHCDGEACHGCPEPGPLLAVWTDRPRLFAKLWTIPGVRRWQTGDREMRALVPPEALEQVAGVIRARRRRPPGSAAHLRNGRVPPVQGDFPTRGARLALGAGSLLGSGHPGPRGAPRTRA